MTDPIVDELAAVDKPRRRRRRLGAGIYVPGAWIAFTVVLAVVVPIVSQWDPLNAAPPDRLLGLNTDGHLLGTDQLGRDLLVRLAVGARLTWIVGISVALISLVLGVLVGAVAGYSRSWLGEGLTRVIDAVLAFPPILLALIFAAILGPSTTTGIIALGIVYAPLVARITRAAVMQERELPYVSASRGNGNREAFTLARHVLPNCVGPLIVIVTIVLGRSMIVEAGLSFLGAGTPPPTPSWGVMVTEAKSVLLMNPTVLIVPALALILTVLSVNLISDRLGDMFGTRGSRDGDSA